MKWLVPYYELGSVREGFKPTLTEAKAEVSPLCFLATGAPEKPSGLGFRRCLLAQGVRIRRRRFLSGFCS